MKVIEANQGILDSLIRKKIKTPSENLRYHKYVKLIKDNLKDVSEKDITNVILEMGKELDLGGCSCANFANLVGYSLINDSKRMSNINNSNIMEEVSKINNTINLDIVNEIDETVDLNMIMLDIYTKLYKKVRAEVFTYETYLAKTPVELVNNLFSKNIENENKALVILNDNHITPDGFENNLYKYKNNIPKKEELTGTIEEISEKLVNKKISNLDELRKILAKENKKIETKDFKINEKLGGLINENFNYWSKYYYDTLNLGKYIKRENFNKNDCNNIYLELDNLAKENILVSVSSSPNKEVRMHNKKPFSWMSISSDKEGHIMMFKGIDKNNNLIVSSFGEDYFVPQEYIDNLLFSKYKMYYERTKNLRSERHKTM